MNTELDKKLSDEALIAAFKQSRKAFYFDSLVNRYKNRLYSVAFNLLGNDGEAEEMVQETFVRVLRNCHRFSPSSTFARWVFSIIQNLCKDIWRNRKRKQGYEITSCNPLSLHEPEDIIGHTAMTYQNTAIAPDYKAEHAEQKAHLLLCIEQLPNRQKEVIILRDLEGQTYKSIASLTGVSIGTVRSRLHYGRLKLRTMMK
mgnify:CR=1 FL=1